jgi:hypothetical protein
MTDTFTEVTTRSWRSRIVESIKGVLFGFVLILGSGAALFWNEGRAVQTQRSLTEGAGVVIDIDPAQVDPANEGKLVHVSGDMRAPAPAPRRPSPPTPTTRNGPRAATIRATSASKAVTSIRRCVTKVRPCSRAT